MKVAFENILPISRIEGNIVVNKYGDIAACFAYHGKEVFAQDKNQLGQTNDFFTSAYGFLDESYVIQKQDIILDTVYDGGEPENNTYLSGAFLNHFKGKHYFKNYSYIYLIKTDVLSIKRDYSTTRHPGNKAKPITASLEEFQITVKHFKDHLKQNGFSLIDIDESHVEKLIEGYFSFFEHGVLTDIAFNPDFKIGDKYGCIYALNNDENQPDQISPFALNSDYSSEDNLVFSDLLYGLGPGLKCNHILNQFIFLDGQRFWKGELEKKSKDLQSSRKFSPGNGKLSSDHDKFMTATTEADGVKKVGRYHMNVIFWGESKAELTNLKGTVKGNFLTLGIIPHEANYLDQKSIWLASAPANGGTMPMQETIVTHTDIATCFLLKESVIDRSKGKPSTHGLMVTDRMSNIPSFRDIWFEPYRTKVIDNRNGLVVGKSGGGKSSTVIEFLRQKLEMGFLVTAIDIGESMELLVEEYKGNYIRYISGMSLGINPFLIPSDRILTVDHLEYLSTFIFVLWKPKEVLEDERRSSLEKVILNAYQATKEGGDYRIGSAIGDTDIKWFYGWVENNKEAIREITRGREEFFDIDSFLITLEQFVHGKFANLFVVKEGENLVDPSKSLTVFELNNIKDHPTLFPIFAMLIDFMSTNVLWKNAKAPKIFLYDEAHKILEKAGMAIQLRFQYKTYRKYDAGVWICIQQISDIDVGYGNIAEAILGNSDIKLIMRHAKDLVPALSQRLAFTSHQDSLLRSIKNNFSGKYPYTEHLNILGADMKVVRTMVSPKQRVIMMSEKSDKEDLRRFVKEEGDWHKGIEAFIKFKQW